MSITWTKTAGGTKVLERSVWDGSPTRIVQNPSRYDGQGERTGRRYTITKNGRDWLLRIEGSPGTTYTNSLTNAKSSAEMSEAAAAGGER